MKRIILTMLLVLIIILFSASSFGAIQKDFTVTCQKDKSSITLTASNPEIGSGSNSALFKCVRSTHISGQCLSETNILKADCTPKTTTSTSKLCSTYQCPAGYKLKQEANTINQGINPTQNCCDQEQTSPIYVTPKNPCEPFKSASFVIQTETQRFTITPGSTIEIPSSSQQGYLIVSGINLENGVDLYYDNVNVGNENPGGNAVGGMFSQFLAFTTGSHTIAAGTNKNPCPPQISFTINQQASITGASISRLFNKKSNYITGQVIEGASTPVTIKVENPQYTCFVNAGSMVKTNINECGKDYCTLEGCKKTYSMPKAPFCGDGTITKEIGEECEPPGIRCGINKDKVCAKTCRCEARTETKECKEGETKCESNFFKECTFGYWGAETNCDALNKVCHPELGCVDKPLEEIDLQTQKILKSPPPINKPSEKNKPQDKLEIEKCPEGSVFKQYVKIPGKFGDDLFGEVCQKGEIVVKRILNIGVCCAKNPDLPQIKFICPKSTKEKLSCFKDEEEVKPLSGNKQEHNKVCCKPKQQSTAMRNYIKNNQQYLSLIHIFSQLVIGIQKR